MNEHAHAEQLGGFAVDLCEDEKTKAILNINKYSCAELKSCNLRISPTSVIMKQREQQSDERCKMTQREGGGLRAKNKIANN